jgi:hypothetical protein
LIKRNESCGGVLGFETDSRYFLKTPSKYEEIDFLKGVYIEMHEPNVMFVEEFNTLYIFVRDLPKNHKPILFVGNIKIIITKIEKILLETGTNPSNIITFSLIQDKYYNFEDIYNYRLILGTNEDNNSISKEPKSEYSSLYLQLNGAEITNIVWNTEDQIDIYINSEIEPEFCNSSRTIKNNYYKSKNIDFVISCINS